MKFELEPYNRDISDEELISDLQRAVKESGKETLSRIEYNKKGKFSEGTLRKRFGGWLNTLEKAGLQKTRTYLTDDELIDELRRVADESKKDCVTVEEFEKLSKLYNPVTIQRRFGSWNNALKKAGLNLSPYGKRYSEEEYFENLLNVWTHYGRQPSADEINRPPSLITRSGYANRFGTWRKALEGFVDRMNREESDNLEQNPEVAEEKLEISEEIKQQSVQTEDKRGIPLGLRYKILSRDNFKCVRCGASPATDPTCKLHIDHIIPFSKSGKTTLENLQTLCEKCNLGKGNRHSE